MQKASASNRASGGTASRADKGMLIVCESTAKGCKRTPCARACAPSAACAACTEGDRRICFACARMIAQSRTARVGCRIGRISAITCASPRPSLSAPATPSKLRRSQQPVSQLQQKRRPRHRRVDHSPLRYSMRSSARREAMHATHNTQHQHHGVPSWMR